MLAAAQEELPEASGGGEEGEGLRRALREAQEQGKGVQEQLFQVTFDVCKHVKDLGGCGRCLNSGVRGLQVLEEVAEKVALFVHETFADDARYTACRSARDGLYGSIMTCAEECLNVLERVKRKLKEEESALYSYGLHHWNSSGSLMDDSAYFDLARHQPDEEPPSPSITSPFVSKEPEGRPAAAPSIRVPGAAGARQRHHGPPLSLPDGAQISRALLGDLECIPTLSDRDLQLEWKIGDGSFGDVWYGQWYGKQDPVAVKVVALCRDSVTNELTLYARSASEDVSDHAATIEAEWEAIRLLPNHENIVTFHSVLWWRPDQGRHLLGENRGQVLCFVMEFCGYGTLLGLIELARKNHAASGPGEAAEADRMRLQQLRKGSNMRAQQQREAGNFYKHWMVRLSVAHQAASGLAFMHSQGTNGIVHRDLASYNILLTHGFHASRQHERDMIPWLRAKICDFGFSRFLGEEDCGRSDSRPSYKWQAPEVLSPDQAQGSYSRASDVYSFGVVLWEIVTLRLPWKGERHLDVLDGVGRRQEQLQWPEPDAWEPVLLVRAELQALIGRCWEPRPEDRPSMQEIVDELGRLRVAEERARQQQRQLEQQRQAEQQQQQQQQAAS